MADNLYYFYRKDVKLVLSINNSFLIATTEVVVRFSVKLSALQLLLLLLLLLLLPRHEASTGLLLFRPDNLGKETPKMSPQQPIQVLRSGCCCCCRLRTCGNRCNPMSLLSVFRLRQERSLFCRRLVFAFLFLLLSLFFLFDTLRRFHVVCLEERIRNEIGEEERRSCC